MRRVWAAVLSVWATIAIVATLAWANAPVRPLAQAAPATVVVTGKNGKQQLVVLPAAAAPHASTHASPPPTG